MQNFRLPSLLTGSRRAAALDDDTERQRAGDPGLSFWARLSARPGASRSRTGRSGTAGSSQAPNRVQRSPGTPHAWDLAGDAAAPLCPPLPVLAAGEPAADAALCPPSPRLERRVPSSPRLVLRAVTRESEIPVDPPSYFNEDLANLPLSFLLTILGSGLQDVAEHELQDRLRVLFRRLPTNIFIPCRNAESAPADEPAAEPAGTIDADGFWDEQPPPDTPWRRIGPGEVPEFWRLNLSAIVGELPKAEDRRALLQLLAQMHRLRADTDPHDIELDTLCAVRSPDTLSLDELNELVPMLCGALLTSPVAFFDAEDDGLVAFHPDINSLLLAHLPALRAHRSARSVAALNGIAVAGTVDAESLQSAVRAVFADPYAQEPELEAAVKLNARHLQARRLQRFALDVEPGGTALVPEAAVTAPVLRATFKDARGRITGEAAKQLDRVAARLLGQPALRTAYLRNYTPDLDTTPGLAAGPVRAHGFAPN